MIDDEEITKDTSADWKSGADEPIYEKESSDAPTMRDEESNQPPEKKERTYRTGTKIAAFFFFILTVAIFSLYEFFAISYLYMPFANGVKSISEAIAAIFGYAFGLVITLIFGVAQLPENIISIILFKRLRGQSDKNWENKLFSICRILSILMLLIMLLTIGVFFAIIGTNS